MVDPDVLLCLNEIEAHWNEAEAYVKHVERLRRGLVVGASINELRYAGRRMVEAYSHLRDNPADPSARAKSLSLLSDVKHFCVRARHDAIDGAVTYVDQALAKLEKEFGPDLLHEKFPKYIIMKQALQEIGAVMAQSRGDREARDRLYHDLRGGLVDGLIQDYLELEVSKEVLGAAYVARIRSGKKDSLRFWLTILIAFCTLVAAVAAVPIIAQKFGLA